MQQLQIITKLKQNKNPTEVGLSTTLPGVTYFLLEVVQFVRLRVGDLMRGSMR